MLWLFLIIKSALWVFLNFVLRTVVLKLFFFIALWWVTTEFLAIVVDKLLPSGDAGIPELVKGLPEAALYFASVTRVDLGLPLVISAWVTRFMIRRIPVIG